MGIISVHEERITDHASLPLLHAPISICMRIGISSPRALCILLRPALPSSMLLPSLFARIVDSTPLLPSC
jgi:hypothetical protein